jgi:phosphatidylserine/phosphatidylglycerophosphate/cardiolipin synthase-like enzyme
MQRYLQSNGVEVEVYPTNEVSLDHVKMLVVDGEEVLVGGVNWSSLFPKHDDADLSIKGPAAKDAETLFDADWNFSRGATVGAPRVKGTDDVRFVTTAPCEEGGGSSDIRNRVLSAVTHAKKRFYVEMFTLNNPDVMQAMADARARGVDVRVILDPTEKSNDKAWDFLKSHGVAVRWHHKVTAADAKADPSLKGREGGWLHAKWGVGDAQELEIGSANWTVQGLDACGPRDDGSRPSAAHDRNHEIDVDIHDGKIASRFEQQFLQDWELRTDK